MTSVQLVDEIRGALAAAGDPEKAVREQAYMKSALPFHGVRLPEVRRITKRLLKEHPLAGRDQWERVIRELWDEVTHTTHQQPALVSDRYWYLLRLLPMLQRDLLKI